MLPIEFMGQDKDLLKAAPGTEDAVIDLPVKRHQQTITLQHETVKINAVTSCWFLTDEEIEKLIDKKVIWFTAWGTTHPPISLSLDKPF
jgi:hypothetical protein